eukprot:TRINITY_DN66406_c9_g2_i1.p1 TRINITY_DN66406_c9_g2~~TRINITY_DN66406_c9_g2_i1.p1  ORF type:complete len:112 (+),score=1.73 TRINITY_DN66406_c9_g2_i1:58-393(+)
MQIFQLFLIVLLSVIYVTSAGLIGGAQEIPNDDSHALEALSFALHEAYPNEHPTGKIIRATKQLVNGLKYELTVEVTLKNKCIVKQFGVWKRAGPPGELLVENTQLDAQCA